MILRACGEGLKFSLLADSEDFAGGDLPALVSGIKLEAGKVPFRLKFLLTETTDELPSA